MNKKESYKTLIGIFLAILLLGNGEEFNLLFYIGLLIIFYLFINLLIVKAKERKQQEYGIEKRNQESSDKEGSFECNLQREIFRRQLHKHSNKELRPDYPHGPQGSIR